MKILFHQCNFAILPLKANNLLTLMHVDIASHFQKNTAYGLISYLMLLLSVHN